MASAVLLLSTTSSSLTDTPPVANAESSSSSSSWRTHSHATVADKNHSGFSSHIQRSSVPSASHSMEVSSLLHHNSNRSNTTTSSSSLTNNPEILAPPLVAVTAPSGSSGGSSTSTDELHNRRCRGCHAVGSMREDWRQGDRVCTACGVVDEERMMDDRPEWKEFTEAEDIVRAAAAGTAGMMTGRSGLVPTDDSKYLGGLQPTTLSSNLFGGGCNGAIQATRKRLLAVNRKINKRMEQMHARALQTTKLSRQAETAKRTRRQQQQQHEEDDDDVCYDEEGESEIRPEFEQLLLQEEEDANRFQNALYADKWSLQRAIRMFGAEYEQTQATREHHPSDEEDDEETTTCRKDSNLRKASQELYCAYSILLSAAQRLHLPDRVTNEAISMLCRYAARRDGLSVRGVASALKQNDQRKSSSNNGSRENKSNDVDTEQAAALAALREYNKMKQMGALTAALLFCTARNHGWPRTIVDVCNSIRPAAANSLLPTGTIDAAVSSNAYLQMWSSNNFQNSSSKETFIKRKHVSRAMTEIKESFPDFARITSSDSTAAALTNSELARPEHAPREDGAHGGNPAMATSVASTSNFLDHVVRKLRLPPVAEASIRALVIFWWHGENRNGQAEPSSSGSNKKNLTTVCAALTYFVCLTGNIMQSLAVQACRSSKRTRTGPLEFKDAKRTKLLKSERHAIRNAEKSMTAVSNVKVEDLFAKTSSDTEEEKPFALSREDDLFAGALQVTEEENPFDVFSKEFESLAAEQKEYEMRRVWDAWNTQLPWIRSLLDIEQSCGVSKKQILEYYKTSLFPRRLVLLTVLKDSVQKQGAGHESIVVSEAPLASVLLPQVFLAAPLLKEDGI